MKGILIFALAVVWGSLSGQFLAQAVTSLVAAVVYIIAAITGSPVCKVRNLTGTLISFSHAIVYSMLLICGYKTVGAYVTDIWSAASVGFLISFLATIVLVAPRVPGKILLARMCARVPNFVQEASLRFPVSERVAFARRWQAKRLSPEKSGEAGREWPPKNAEAEPATEGDAYYILRTSRSREQRYAASPSRSARQTPSRAIRSSKGLEGRTAADRMR
jgi:hypothetical protein